MAANIIESFFVSLGFEIDTQKLEEFDRKMESARSLVLTVGGVATAAAGAIGVFVSKVAGSIDELGDFAELNQVGIEALQEFGYAAQLNGSSLEAVKASVAGVNKTVGEAALGIGRGAQTFEKLGMSAKNADGSIKTFDQLMQEVAEKMDGLSRQEQIAMAEKLGIDRSLIPLLAKGRDELEALRAEAQAFGVTSEEDAKKAGALTDSLDRTKFMVGALGKYIAVGLMPQVTTVLDGFRDWMVSNQKVIKSGIGAALKTVTAILGTMWDWVVRVADGLVDLVKWLIDFKIVAYAAAAAVGALISLGAFKFFAGLASIITKATGRMALFNATALIIPAIIGAIILALGLLIDDYVNWKEGNDSVIGGLVEQFPMLLDIIKTIEDGVGSFIDFWMQQWDTLKEPLSSLAGSIWKLVSTVASALWPVLKMVFTGWAYLLAAVIPVVATVIEWLAGFLVGAIGKVIDALTWIVQTATAVFQAVVAVVQFAIDAIVAYFTWWAQTVAAIYEFIAGAIGKVVDTVMGGVKGTVDWVMGVIDAAKQKVMGFVDSVVGAIATVIEAGAWLANVFAVVFTGIQDGISFVVGLFDAAREKVVGFIDMVAGAIGKVGELLGLSSKSGEVKVSVTKQDQTAAGQATTPVAAALAQAPAIRQAGQPSPAAGQATTPVAAAGGVIGRAGDMTNNSSTVTQTTQITGTTIQINSPDPAKAGEAVRQELERMNKQAVRNGQTAVAL